MALIGQTGKPVIGIVGFFGRGNSGDEAMLQCIYEVFCKDFDLLICVDKHGAFRRWQDWYPYNQSMCLHQGSIQFFERGVAGLIVGGGGLTLGFAADHVLVARAKGTPTALVGVDYPNVSSPNDNIRLSSIKTYLDLFDYVALRTLFSSNSAQIDKFKVHYGADWALRLNTDCNKTIQPYRNQVSITLRELQISAIDVDTYVNEVCYLLDQLNIMGWSPVFLPLCPEDTRFLKQLNLIHRAPLQEHWWNPRAVQQVIQCSQFHISVGRLHSMIFAINTRTPNIQIDYHFWKNTKDGSFISSDKLRSMADEFQVHYFLTIRDAVSF